MARLLDRNAILTAEDLPTEEVEIKEWGGSVLVRGLTGAQRDDFERRFLEWRDKNQATLGNIRATLAAWCIVNEKGERIFTTNADIKLLGEKSAQALDRVFEMAQRLSGLSDEDVEELAGNSPGAPNGASGSD